MCVGQLVMVGYLTAAGGYEKAAVVLPLPFFTYYYIGVCRATYGLNREGRALPRELALKIDERCKGREDVVAKAASEAYQQPLLVCGAVLPGDALETEDGQMGMDGGRSSDVEMPEAAEDEGRGASQPLLRRRGGAEGVASYGSGDDR